MTEPRQLALRSTYQNQTVLGAHQLRLQLRQRPDRMDQMEGHLQIDPNHCTLDLWGDTKGCTRMAVRSVPVITTMTRTADTAGHHRAHHQVAMEGSEDRGLHLIEYPRLHLWYLVYQTAEHGSFVVPLFPEGSF